MELPNSFYSGIPVVESDRIDYLGALLSIGDKVVFHNQNYRNFETGIIKRFTPKGLVIETNYKYQGEFRQGCKQVIKIG